MGLTPSSPPQADQRMIRKLLGILYANKTEHRPDEYKRISRVFGRAKGSWEGVFQGSTSDLGLLKKIIHIAYKKGFLTKKQSWSPSKQEDG